MQISYNGAVFDVVHLEDWSREAVYADQAKTTFCWWHHKIVVTCILNEQATSSFLFPPRFAVIAGGNDAGAPGQIRGQKPKNIVPEKLGTVDEQIEAANKQLVSGLGTGSVIGAALGAAALIKAADAKYRIQRFKDRVQTGESVFGIESRTVDPNQPRVPQSTTPPPGSQDIVDAAKRQADDAAAAAAAASVMSGAEAAVGLALQGLGFPGSVKAARDIDGAAGLAGLIARAKAGAKVIKQPAARGTVPFTDVDLRERLKEPRRQLLVWLYSGPAGAPEFMITSPLHPDAGSDAQHGPLCTILDVPEIHGQMSAVMRLQFETWEAPALSWKYQESDAIKSQKQRLAEQIEKNLKKLVKDAKLALGEDGATVDEIAIEDGLKAYANAVIKPDGNPALAKIEARTAVIKRLGDAGLGALIGRAIGAPGGKVADAVVAQIEANEALVDPGQEEKIRKKILQTPALVSNRWQMSFGWDTTRHLRTQKITGEAIFRMDVLRMKKLTADQLRQQIWHPIPDGYIRRPSGDGDITVSDAGDGINYTITDEEQMTNMPGAAKYGIIGCEISEGFEYNGYGITEAGDAPGDQPGNMKGGRGGSNLRGGSHTSEKIQQHDIDPIKQAFPLAAALGLI